MLNVKVHQKFQAQVKIYNNNNYYFFNIKILAPIPTKFDVGLSSLSSENRSNASLSLNGSRTSLIYPSTNNLNKIAVSTPPGLIRSNFYSSATSIVTTFGVSNLTTTKTTCIPEINQNFDKISNVIFYFLY